MSTVELQCYNKGCGKKFKEEDNKDDACVYHPGEPVFHDALKGWSCCKKRSTDFTLFLNMPGCAKGNHNPVKPAEPERPKINPLVPGEVVEVRAPKPKVPTLRPSDDIPLKPLKTIVSTSLKSALTRLKLQEQNASPSNGDDQTDNSENIQFGTRCKHHGCETEYQGNESELSDCRHHPGTAIFHEGYKFWTCCQRRTSDFNEFVKQEGCKSGDHLWRDEEAEKKALNYCRYDWHQTGSTVVISIYAKCAVPEGTQIEANPTNVSVSLSFEGGKKMYTNSWKLGGVIDPDKCSVDLLGTKAEIRLRKAEAMAWKTLQYKNKVES